MKKTITLRYKTCHCEAVFISSMGTEAFFLKKSWFVFTISLVRSYLEMAVPSCVAVLATTPLTVWTTHVTLWQKNVERLVEFTAATLKVFQKTTTIFPYSTIIFTDKLSIYRLSMNTLKHHANFKTQSFFIQSSTLYFCLNFYIWHQGIFPSQEPPPVLPLVTPIITPLITGAMISWETVLTSCPSLVTAQACLTSLCTPTMRIATTILISAT